MGTRLSLSTRLDRNKLWPLQASQNISMSSFSPVIFLALLATAFAAASVPESREIADELSALKQSNADLLEMFKEVQREFSELKAATGFAASAYKKKANKPRDCNDVKQLNPYASNGVFTITPQENVEFEVFCEFNAEGENWTVFHKRFDGSQDFKQTLVEYGQGFGDVKGEHFLGLQQIHLLTSVGKWQLRVDLEDFEGNTAKAVYDEFEVGAGLDYTLYVSGFQQEASTAGDSLIQHHGQAFSCPELDQDSHDDENCAEVFQGCWWYYNCYRSNLNAFTYFTKSSPESKSMNWHSWEIAFTPLKASSMKMRTI